MVSYTTPQAIANYLGATFTPEQDAQALAVADGVTVWIDHRTGRTWQSTGTIADEIQTVHGTTAYLSVPPVVAVTSVELSDKAGGWSAVDPAQYALTDPAHGTLTFVGGYNNASVRVDYTSDATAPPADIALAATILAAELMTVVLHPESAGVESIAVGQNDINLKYAGASGNQSAAAQTAVRIVDSYRRVVLA
jgi:hypothetical protein